jgi:hypothetical protein
VSVKSFGALLWRCCFLCLCHLPCLPAGLVQALEREARKAVDAQRIAEAEVARFKEKADGIQRKVTDQPTD